MPLQSGSDKILQAMRRSYRVERYRGIIEKVRSAMPHSTITTDVIVGFPGETEADFQETMDLCKELRFLAAYSFKYSKRPGTPAAEMPDQISEDVVAERYDRLHKRLNEVSLSVNEDVVGKESEVLITDIEQGRAQGKSRDFRLVHLDVAEGDARPGDIARVRVTGAKPHFIFGEKLVIKKTRGGDAFEVRKLEAENSGVFLGVPQLKSSLVK
jgi:tRNA-2-methylthio-N6-dimethylallyladenosine synthase